MATTAPATEARQLAEADHVDVPIVMRRRSDPANFNAGSVMRSQHLRYRPGDHEPWIPMQEHDEERDLLPTADLDDGTLVYR